MDFDMERKTRASEYNFTLGERKQLEEPLAKAYVEIVSPYNIGVAFCDYRDSDENGKKSGDIYILPAAYDSRAIDAKSSSSVEISRLKLIAKLKKAKVIFVEHPGVGVSGKARTDFIGQLQDLNCYRWSAEKMLDAIFDPKIGLSEGEAVHFLGFAQGASVGVAMIDLLSEKDYKHSLKVKDLTLIEPINNKLRFLPEILKKVGDEVKNGKHHFADNEQYSWLNNRSEEIESNILELKRKQNLATVMSGLALGFRPFEKILQEAITNDDFYETSGISSAKINFVKFNDSEISGIESIKKTANRIAKMIEFSGEIAVKNVLDPSRDLKMEAYQSMLTLSQLIDEKVI